MKAKMTGKTLIIGANGFLGSHVTQLLAQSGRDVSVLIRKSSDTRAIDHLNIKYYYGDILDKRSITQAMANCDSVFYCVAGSPADIKDPHTLYHTHVHGLYNVMDAALETKVKRFVFASCILTLEPGNLHGKHAYLITPEKRLLEYCHDRQFPGIICCIGYTYGHNDFRPRPYRRLLLSCAKGKLPIYWKGGTPSVGVRDAARAMIQAEQKGKTGERYTIVERWLSHKELFTLGTQAAGRRPPMVYIPLTGMYLITTIIGFARWCRGKEQHLSVSSLKRTFILQDISNLKAKTELGWQPRPIEESIREAVAFYLNRRQHKNSDKPPGKTSLHNHTHQ